MPASEQGGTSAVRTRAAPGRRFVVSPLRVLAAGLVAGLLGLAAACAAAGPPPGEPPPPPPEPRLPSIDPGAPASSAAEADAVRLIALASDTLEAGFPREAFSLAGEVVERYPGVPGSSEALWIRARAGLEIERPEEAAEAAGAFAAALPASHPLKAPARFVEGRTLLSEGRVTDALGAFLGIPLQAPDSIRTRALERIREEVVRLDHESLQELYETSPDGAPLLRAPLLAELALAQYGRGETAEAAETARAALDAGARGEEAEVARQIVSGDVTAARRQAAVLGVLLPESGSPGQQQFATYVRDGIQARLEAGDRDPGAPIRLRIGDDRGRPEVADSLVRALARGGAVGFLGPLTDRSLETAARARRQLVPMISPTATRLPGGEPAVYTLRGADPGAARTLARYAVSEELDDAVVLHGPSAEAGREAELFIREYGRLGGRVMRRLSFQEGATFFRGPLRTVSELRPDALVLPVDAQEIELLAPQLTYFGLDTLGIRFLGTAEWAEPGVLGTIPQRHTDGFVVATPRRPGGPTEAYLRFVDDYETVLRKTLRSSIPALGYDAAGLMLEALASGMRSPRALRAALEQIRDFPGATGTLSIEDGRVLREHHLVRLRDGDMIPIPLEDPDARLMPAFPMRREGEPPAPASAPVREGPRR